jgi:universal stress protein E
MRPLRKILFATEFRPSCESAIRMTASLVQRFGAQVTVLGVRESFADGPADHPMLREECEILFQQVLHRFQDLEIPVVHSLLKTGPVAGTIVEIAAEMDVDLIVLGAGKNTTYHAFHVGAVTQAVIEQATQPVLAVYPSLSEELLANPFRTIVCPLDHSEVSRRGLLNAIQLAKAYGSKLLLLSIIPDVSWLTAMNETRELTEVKIKFERQWYEEQQKFVAATDFQGVAYTQEVLAGVPHEQIIAVAKTQEADLIAMGATGRSGLVKTLLGSTTRRVIRELPCSLLTVKQEMD